VVTPRCEPLIPVLAARENTVRWLRCSRTGGTGLRHCDCRHHGRDHHHQPGGLRRGRRLKPGPTFVIGRLNSAGASISWVSDYVVIADETRRAFLNLAGDGGGHQHRRRPLEPTGMVAT
jgi:hypothetical protein